MSILTNLIGKQVNVKLAGDKSFEGILTDEGQNILVLYNGQEYYYIPLIHIISISNVTGDKIVNSIEDSIMKEMNVISYRNILTNVKRNFVEISVKSNLTFHGYILNILSDYLVFYSPVFKTMYLSLAHLKWLRLYNQNRNPYNLTKESFPDDLMNGPMSHSLESQLKKIEGKIIVIDGGSDSMKIGLLNKVDNSLIELVQASGEINYLRLSHIKSIHVP
ncbi:DUF6897 domain-containing protein [Gottfriedia luciferensis]|uniref:DUF6897 domain-containing protein n=1 Tax=Gottfriedia luciferensis TaxID=178774 RepID=UPI000B435CD4|nr:DUF2642 domain-containing protein [Gottfriedia luciferensis]